MTMSAESNPWHKILLPKATHWCQAACCREQPSHTRSHAAKEIAALLDPAGRRGPCGSKVCSDAAQTPTQHKDQVLGRASSICLSHCPWQRDPTCTCSDLLRPRQPKPKHWCLLHCRASLSHARRPLAPSSACSTLTHAATFSKKRVRSTELCFNRNIPLPWLGRKPPFSPLSPTELRSRPEEIIPPWPPDLFLVELFPAHTDASC